MQLGELQSQHQRFTSRGSSVVALSVDPTSDSRSLLRRLKIKFPIISDETQEIMQAYRVQNQETKELALHAVFIVDENREIFYRKVAGKRPLSQELLDAIDYEYGRYPLGDIALEEGVLNVAYPRNNFQAIIAVSASTELPSGITAASLQPTIELIQKRRWDDAIFAYRRFIANQKPQANEEDLIASVVWLTQQIFETNEETIETGRELSTTLRQLSRLREQMPQNKQAISELETDLEFIREKIRENADVWKLRSIKGLIRSYRELAIAASTS